MHYEGVGVVEHWGTISRTAHRCVLKCAPHYDTLSRFTPHGLDRRGKALEAAQLSGLLRAPELQGLRLCEDGQSDGSSQQLTSGSAPDLVGARPSGGSPVNKAVVPR